jgi:SPP1 family predicted phage head-tail adaptor
VPRQTFKRPNRQFCLGDLDKRIIIKNRSIQVPEFKDADFTEKFDGDKEVWANIKTTSGQTIFVVNTDVAMTHMIGIRYDPSVTSESWVEFEGNNLKILTVEDIDEEHEFMMLRCTKRGDSDLGAAQA